MVYVYVTQAKASCDTPAMQTVKACRIAWEKQNFERCLELGKTVRTDTPELLGCVALYVAAVLERNDTPVTRSEVPHVLAPVGGSTFLRRCSMSSTLHV